MIYIVKWVQPLVLSRNMIYPWSTVGSESCQSPTQPGQTRGPSPRSRKIRLGFRRRQGGHRGHQGAPSDQLGPGGFPNQNQNPTFENPKTAENTTGVSCFRPLRKTTAVCENTGIADRTSFLVESLECQWSLSLVIKGPCRKNPIYPPPNTLQGIGESCGHVLKKSSPKKENKKQPGQNKKCFRLHVQRKQPFNRWPPKQARPCWLSFKPFNGPKSGKVPKRKPKELRISAV